MHNKRIDWGVEALRAQSDASESYWEYSERAAHGDRRWIGGPVDLVVLQQALQRQPLVLSPSGLSINSECLDRMVPLGERHLRLAVTEYVEHYHAERHHQGLGNRLIGPNQAETDGTGDVLRRERLGGMLSFYYREAA